MKHSNNCPIKGIPHPPHQMSPPSGIRGGVHCGGFKEAKVNVEDDEPDGAPCCPDPGCSGNPCTFPGYVVNN